MTLPNILPSEKIIVVVGFPATGKTFLADNLVKDLSAKVSPIKYYHTDDYIKYGFEESLYVLLKDLQRDKEAYKIIEGVQGYRLLRKGIELNNFYPSLVIVCEASSKVRLQRYHARGKKLNWGFDGVLHKIWLDYLAMLEQPKLYRVHKPRFITIDTSI